MDGKIEGAGESWRSFLAPKLGIIKFPFLHVYRQKRFSHMTKSVEFLHILDNAHDRSLMAVMYINNIRSIGKCSACKVSCYRQSVKAQKSLESFPRQAVSSGLSDHCRS